MDTPAMSYVVVTDHYRTIRRVAERLAAQTAKDQIEVIVVAPKDQDLGLDTSIVKEFAAFRTVLIESIWPMSIARAAGVRAATAPVVFIGETHSFPRAGFCAALIEAQTDPWDVVVPGLLNGNPTSPLSWAAFLMDYGGWLNELPGGSIEGGPTWNVGYRRSVIMAMDGALNTALSHGDDMAVALRARASRIRFVPAAQLEHVNVEQIIWWVEQRFLTGRLVAASRMRRWSAAKRLAYVCASPLVPFVILSRIARPVHAALTKCRLPFGTIPALVVGTVVRTAGEVVGYVCGAAAGSQRRMDEYELYKLKFTSLPF
jgi:hypothetical protein